ncbi:MAG: aldo/keto reductase [Gemmobacter sp.]
MRYRKFGKTDLEFSEITFGALRFVDGAQAKNDEDLGRRALLDALDAGVNAIHSSYEYGTRWALERILAEHPRRAELHHIIKVPSPDYTDPGFSDAQFRTHVETALRELKTERIAIVQHLQRGVAKDIIYDERGDPDRLARMDATNAALTETAEAMRREGKLGYVITFPHTVGFARPAIASGAFDGLIAFWNFLETEMLDVLDDCAERGLGAFSMRPYLQGIITDKRANRSSLSADDPKRDPAWDRHYDLFVRVQTDLGPDIASWSDAAIRFALSHPAITSVVVSLNNPDQVRAAIAAIDGRTYDRAFVERVAGLAR